MNRFLFLLVLFFCPVFSSAKHPIFNMFDPTDSMLPRMSPEDAGIIYQMLKIIDELFTEHDIPYWIDSGTALGAVRHKGLIPWDDDGDLVFFIEDEDRIFALANEFARYGFVLKKHEIFRLYPSKKKSHPFIDIAGYTLLPNNTLHFKAKISRNSYPKFYWLPEEVEHLVRVPFGPITLNAPHKMRRYLRTVYGDDFMTKAIFQPPHNSNGFSLVTKSKVKIVDYSPAKYKPVHPRIPLD